MTAETGPNPDGNRKNFWQRVRQDFFHECIAGFLTLLFFLILLWVLLSVLGDFRYIRYRQGEGYLEYLNTGIRNIIFLVAGGVASVLTIWRGKKIDKQNDIADKQRKLSELAHQNKRFLASVKMLGGDNLYERTGAIYALTDLVKENSDKFRGRVRKILLEFLRLSPRENSEEKKSHG